MIDLSKRQQVMAKLCQLYLFGEIKSEFEVGRRLCPCQEDVECESELGRQNYKDDKNVCSKTV